MPYTCGECRWSKELGRTLWCGRHDKAIRENLAACDHYESAAAHKAALDEIDEIIDQMCREADKERNAKKRNVNDINKISEIDVEIEIDKKIDAVCTAEKARIIEQSEKERLENEPEEFKLPPKKYFVTFLKDSIAWVLALLFIGGGICAFLFF